MNTQTNKPRQTITSFMHQQQLTVVQNDTTCVIRCLSSDLISLDSVLY